MHCSQINTYFLKNERKCLLSTGYMPGTVRSTGQTAMETANTACPAGLACHSWKPLGLKFVYLVAWQCVN